MDENITGTANTETAADDWDSMDFSDVSDNTAPQSAEQNDDNESETEADQTDAAEGEAEQGNADTAEANQQKPDAQKGETAETDAQNAAESNQTFKLKYLGEEREVSKDEAITLAQKGMDYDRVRQKHDEAISENDSLKEKLAPIEELANSQGMTLDQLVEQTAASLLAQREGIDMSIAVGRVRNDMAAKKLEKEKAALTAQKTESDNRTARMQADIEAFKAAYPDVYEEAAKGKSPIPQEVWDAVNHGDTLMAAYSRWDRARLQKELAELKTQMEKAQQKEKNKARSTGPLTSVGEETAKDAIDLDWDNGT
jgi:hypothetical protein